MSRTYRRTKKTPSWVGEFSTYANGTFGTHLWEYRSDKFNCQPWSKTVKYHTNRQRRADDRRQIHALMRDAEYDFCDYHKKYLGFVWIYD